MPVKLANGALLEVQLGTSDVVALGQIGDDLLADPATIVDVGLALAEAPFQALDAATVGGLATEIVGVLEVNGVVGATWVCVSDVAMVMLQVLVEVEGGSEVVNVFVM